MKETEWISVSSASTEFIVEKWLSKAAYRWGIYEVGGEVPGRSLGGIILNGPLTLSR
jgi:hypothetical protein